MKIVSSATVNVIAKGEPTKSLDGKSTYYKITVLQGAEAGQLSVPEDLYYLLKVGESVSLNLEYNDQYKSLKVLSINYNSYTAPHPATTAPSPEQSAQSPAGNQDKQGKQGK